MPTKSSRAGPGGRTRQPLLLRHPQHRRGGEGGRGARAARPLPEHRRSGRVRLQDARPSGRSRRTRHARRPQRLSAVGRHSRRRARRWPPTTRARGIADVARPRAHHDRHVRRHRAGAQRARRRGRRSARAVADLSALHRGAGEDRRPTSVLPHRSGARLAAGPRSPAHARHAADARARRHRSEQPDRRRLSRRRSGAR